MSDARGRLEERRLEELRQARLEMPRVTVRVMADGQLREISGYLRHTVSESNALMVWTVDPNGDEWPAFTAAPGRWESVEVLIPQEEPWL